MSIENELLEMKLMKFLATSTGDLSRNLPGFVKKLLKGKFSMKSFAIRLLGT